MFRATHDVWAGDPAFAELLTRLREGSPEFVKWWGAHEVHGTLSGRKTMTHPTKGVLHFEHTSFQANDDPALKLVIDGKLRPATTTTPGTTFLYDLRTNPVAEIYSSFDNIRFYISQASLDELAFDQGIRRTRGTGFGQSMGFPDRVMFGLANALLDHVERANERSTLFIDHVALAFYAHVMRAYGNAAGPGRVGVGRIVALAASSRARLPFRASQ